MCYPPSFVVLQLVFLSSAAMRSILYAPVVQSYGCWGPCGEGPCPMMALHTAPSTHAYYPMFLCYDPTPSIPCP
eukprot:352749-Rhodomonas_salina.1